MLKFIKKYPAIFLLVILAACSNQNKEKFSPELINTIKLNMPELSGLAISYDGKFLWTVSDSNSTVYQISFEGEIQKSFTVNGGDLEGVTQINDSTLAVVLERDRTILIIDTSGNELNRIEIIKEGDLNSGFEGITFNPGSGHFYILNEKDPGSLIEIDDFYNFVKETKLKFAKDYSGIHYDAGENILWIISDESSLIAKCDLNGNLIGKTELKLRQIEGVAVDNKNKKLYIISDIKEELYVFQF